VPQCLISTVISSCLRWTFITSSCHCNAQRFGALVNSPSRFPLRDRLRTGFSILDEPVRARTRRFLIWFFLIVLSGIRRALLHRTLSFLPPSFYLCGYVFPTFNALVYSSPVYSHTLARLSRSLFSYVPLESNLSDLEENPPHDEQSLTKRSTRGVR